MGRGILVVIFIFTLFQPVSANAQEASRGEPAAFLVGAGAEAGVIRGDAVGVFLGGAADVSLRPIPEIGIELSAGGQTFIGWNMLVGLSATCYLGSRDSTWHPGIGLFTRAQYGSTVMGYNQGVALPSSVPLGPWWSYSGGLVISPLEFRYGWGDLRFIRILLGMTMSLGSFSPAADIELLGVAWRI
jgi:hypothetical protein